LRWLTQVNIRTIMPPKKAHPSERRRFERVKVNLKVQWEGVLEQKQGMLVDLSVGGCFVLTSHLVKPRELIRLEIEGSLTIWGEVIYQIEEMGFGIKFNASLGEAEELAQLVQAHKKPKNEGK